MAYPLSRKILGPIFKRRLVSVEGLERLPTNGAFLVVANHVGYQDPVLMVTALALHTHRKIHAVAKWKMLRIPIIRRWTGIIPLMKDRAKTVAATLHQLARGRIVLIYPEGTVNFSEVIKKTKTGAARLAIESGCTVIPAGIRRVSAHPKTPFAKYAEIFTGHMRVYFGKPMRFSQKDLDDVSQAYIHDVHNQIMQAVALLAQKKYTPLR